MPHYFARNRISAEGIKKFLTLGIKPRSTTYNLVGYIGNFIAHTQL